MEVRVTAEAEIETEGVYFWLDIPPRSFAGRNCHLLAGEMPQDAVLPVEKPGQRHFARGTADRLVFRAPNDRARPELKLDRPLPVTVQGNREFGGGTYSAFFRLDDDHRLPSRRTSPWRRRAASLRVNSLLAPSSPLAMWA